MMEVLLKVDTIKDTRLLLSPVHRTGLSYSYRGANCCPSLSPPGLCHKNCVTNKKSWQLYGHFSPHLQHRGSMSGMVGWGYWVLSLSSQLTEWWFHAGKGKPGRQAATAPFHHASHNTEMSLWDKQPTVPYYRSRPVAQVLCPWREAAVKTEVSLWEGFIWNHHWEPQV